LGNSKHTLLLSRESNNPPANGLEYVLLFRLSKHRFLMPKLPKRRTGMKGWEDLRKWLYLHECLQACPRFNLPAVHPAIRLACRQVSQQAGIQANLPTDRAPPTGGSNIIWNGMGLKGTVLLVFSRKMSNKCTVVIRLSLYS